MANYYGGKLFFLFFVYIGIYLQSFLLVPILARSLGVETYGVWSQIRVSVDFLVPFCLLALPAAFSRFTAGQIDKRIIAANYYTVLSFVSFSGGIVCLFFYLMSDFVTSNFIKTEMNVVPIVGVSSLLIIVRTIRQFSTDYFRVFQQEKTFSFFMTFQSLGVILAVYALIKTGHTLYHIVWAIIIIDLFLFICAQIIISGKIGVAKPDLKILAVFFNFCIPLFPASLLHWVTSLSDRYVIGFFRPVSDVASYSACCMLSMVIMFFYAPFYAILAPKLTQLWEVNNEATLKRVFYFSNKIPLLVSIPAVFGIGVLSPEILKLLTGSYLPGTFLLSAIICTGYIFFYVGCYYVQVFSLVKKTKYSTFGHLISAIINLLGNVILVPLIGILGAAIMTMLTFLFQMLYFMKVSRRYYDIALKWDFLWGSLSASFLMALVVWTMKTFLLRSVNTPSLIILIVSGVVCYLALLVLFSVIEPKEINSIKNIFVK